MLTRDDVLNCYQRLAMAGLKVPENLEQQVEDFIQHFSYFTADDLYAVTEILRDKVKYWPNYSEFAAAYRERYELVSRQKNDGVNAMLNQDEHDAYPDGMAWQDKARSFCRTYLPQVDSEAMEENLPTIYWCLQGKEYCERCNGYNCPYLGHKRDVRVSENKKEVFRVLIKDKCPRFVGYASRY